MIVYVCVILNLWSWCFCEYSFSNWHQSSSLLAIYNIMYVCTQLFLWWTEHDRPLQLPVPLLPSGWQSSARLWCSCCCRCPVAPACCQIRSWGCLQIAQAVMMIIGVRMRLWHLCLHACVVCGCHSVSYVSNIGLHFSSFFSLKIFPSLSQIAGWRVGWCVDDVSDDVSVVWKLDGQGKVMD